MIVVWKRKPGEFAEFCVILAKMTNDAFTDIRFQFVGRLDCEDQTEDSRGQARTDESADELHLLVE